MMQSKLFLAGAVLTAVSAVLLIAARLFLDPGSATPSARTAVNAAFGASQLGLFLVLLGGARHVMKAVKNRN